MLRRVASGLMIENVRSLAIAALLLEFETGGFMFVGSGLLRGGL
jgi:hypothetical protein